MNIKNRQHLLAIVAGVAVALLVGDRFVISPLFASWKQRGSRIVELNKSVAKGSLVLMRERAIRSRWDQMRTNTLPVLEAERQVLEAFERWSQDSRISITSIKPQWKRPADDYATLECRADGFGSMQALTRFLHNVEQDPLALKVDAVEISARDNSGQQLSLALQVSGLVLNPQEQ